MLKQGRRISARHIRQMEKAKINKLPVPTEYLIGKVLAKPVIDEETGEIIAEANAEITPEVLKAIYAKQKLIPFKRCIPMIWIVVLICPIPCVLIQLKHN